MSRGLINVALNLDSLPDFINKHLVRIVQEQTQDKRGLWIVQSNSQTRKSKGFIVNKDLYSILLASNKNPTKRTRLYGNLRSQLIIKCFVTKRKDIYWIMTHRLTQGFTTILQAIEINGVTTILNACDIYNKSYSTNHFKLPALWDYPRVIRQYTWRKKTTIYSPKKCE